MKTAILVKIDINEDSKTVLVNTEFVDVSATKEKQTELQKIYELLDCQTIDIIGTGKVDIYIDDEGLLFEDNPVLKFPLYGKEITIAGNFLFSNGIDDEGETVWFNEDRVQDQIRMNKIQSSISRAKLLGFTDV